MEVVMLTQLVQMQSTGLLTFLVLASKRCMIYRDQKEKRKKSPRRELNVRRVQKRYILSAESSAQSRCPKALYHSSIIAFIISYTFPQRQMVTVSGPRQPQPSNAGFRRLAKRAALLLPYLMMLGHGTYLTVSRELGGKAGWR